MLTSLAAFLWMTTPVAEAGTNQTHTTLTPFADITGHWAQNEITMLYENGAIKADANLNATFKPDQLITRGELITLFLAAKGIQPDPVKVSHFADIPLNHWLIPYAETAYRLGFVHGTLENNQLLLIPDEPVEKQELLSILLRAKGVSGEVNKIPWTEINQTLSPFADQKEVAKWNLQGFVYALEKKIINPDDDNTLQPARTMTRAEAAVYAYQNLLPPPSDNKRKLDGIAIPYKQVMTVETSAYTGQEAKTSEPVSEPPKTKLGWPVREGIVAVDPNVIPLGTHLYIEGYGYAVAADVGSGVKQQHVDVFLPSLEAALAYGRQKDINVYILD